MMHTVCSKITQGKGRGTWQRLGFMLILVICYAMAESLLLLVIGWQAIAALVGGSPQDARMRVLGGQLSRYIYQIFLYLTYNSNQRPYPFSPWPGGVVPPP